ncbi:MAG: penicillin acylase family protein [Streptosporangiaceae bacterium]
MLAGRTRWRFARRTANIAAAACASAALLVLCGVGYAGLPGLGRTLVPGHGAWAAASSAGRPRSEPLTLPGLAHPALVYFTAAGVPSIEASDLPDAMLALGYLHARFRLAQMDVQRRLAEGTLSALLGPRALGSDAFELKLGLIRTAQREWAAMRGNSTAATMLTGYAAGVNDYLSQLRASGQWPEEFTLTGVYPAPWTPVDSLAVQGLLSQSLGCSASPLDYAVLVRSLGLARTMAWFPVLPASSGQPFDAGPYRPAGAATKAQTAAAQGQPVQPGVAEAAAAVLRTMRGLPAGLAGARLAAGTGWAVNGPRVAGGGALLAGTGPLPAQLPSSWFQVAVAAPGYDVSGGTIPGLPGILAGHNERIAWTVTGAQNQSALFYAERTSATRPGQYFWRGRWRPMRALHYLIRVRGGPPRRLTVDQTAHGPVLTTEGSTLAVDWTGLAGTPDVAVLAGLGAARNFAQFRAALASWRSPALTFVYADRQGNIGAATAGSYPVVRHGSPWLPLPGTGVGDVTGVVPLAALPHAYDPPGHVIVTAGQRSVGATYPYFLGTTSNELDVADAAGQATVALGRKTRMGPSALAMLQTSQQDPVAARLTPKLLAALRHARLTPAEQSAATVLSGWNGTVSARSAAAAIWPQFWAAYLSAVFGPWWRAGAVPASIDPAGLGVWTGQLGLTRLLAQWTLTDQGNPAFTPPGGPVRRAPAVLRAAFATAVARLTARLGGPPSGWALDRLPAAGVTALSQLPVLTPGRGAGSWPAAVTAGAGSASWRMISWLPRRGTKAGHTGIGAELSYPGGASENPASPWYANMSASWRAGGYLLLPRPGVTSAGQTRWELLP